MAQKEKGMGKGLSALLGDDFSADFTAPSSSIRRSWRNWQSQSGSMV